MKKALKILDFQDFLPGRGSKTRTHNKGFGDPRVTITPCPCAAKDIIRRIQLLVNRFFEACGMA